MVRDNVTCFQSFYFQYGVCAGWMDESAILHVSRQLVEVLPAEAILEFVNLEATEAIVLIRKGGETSGNYIRIYYLSQSITV